MKTKTIIPIILALVLVSTGLAFTIEANPEQNTISINDIATYNLVINNDLASEDSYTIKAPGAELDWTVIPVFQADVPASGSKSVLLQLTPKALLSLGRYHVLSILVTSTKTGEIQTIPVRIFLKTDSLEKEYQPNVQVNTYMRNKRRGW